VGGSIPQPTLDGGGEGGEELNPDASGGSRKTGRR